VTNVLLPPSLDLTYLNICLIAKHTAGYVTIGSRRHYWLPAVITITSKALTVFCDIIKKGRQPVL